MITRYDFELYHCNGGDMEVSEGGEYVAYEDYEALYIAARSLIEDVRLRYPNQELYCPHMRVLDKLTSS